jgi:acid stress-induced BolA-like protein IbaG/YrbA
MGSNEAFELAVLGEELAGMSEVQRKTYVDRLKKWFKSGCERSLPIYGGVWVMLQK